MRAWFLAAVLTLTTLALPGTADAQGALLQGSVSAAVADGTTSPAFGGGVGWRFNSVLGIGVELSHLRSLRSSFAHIYCCGSDDERTRATVFTTNVRLEIPTMSRRVIPFVVGGGGVAGVSESYDVYYAAVTNGLSAELMRLGMNTFPVLPGPSPVTTTTTSLALTLGGGASVLLSEHVAVDADLRVLHIMSNPSRNIGRFGVGVSYRF